MGTFTAYFNLKMSNVIIVTHMRHSLNKWLRIMMPKNC